MLILLGILIFVALFIIISAFNSIVIVKQQTLVIIERLGKYNRILGAGINFKIPFIENRAAELDMRVQQITHEFETKTSDNVFVDVQVAVQYFIIPNKAYEAHYKLENPENQIQAYIGNVIRSEIPKKTLDNVFAEKDSVAQAVESHLKQTMEDFGYTIVTALVTNIDPAEGVKTAMNDIETQKRQKLATIEAAEGKKAARIAEAQAESESMKLKGEGMAAQRKAIIDGLKTSVDELKEATGVDAKEAMSLVTMTSYFDMMEKIGDGAKVIFMDKNPGAVAHLKKEIQEAIMSANHA